MVFPRGSATAQDHGQQQDEHHLFGRKRSGARPPGGKKKKTRRPHATGGSDPVAENAMAAPKKVNLLTYRRLSVGMGLLGHVADIRESSVTLSLPNNLTGHVSYLELSERHAAAAVDDGEEGDADAKPAFPCLSGVR